MLFISTRGGADLYSSAHVITKGLAKDGGLFVPQKFPRVHIDDIMALHSLGYATSAAQVLSIFLTDYTKEELNAAANAAYGGNKFDDNRIIPLVEVTENTDILELWHGPTSAFKDMALQILPHLLTKALEKTGEKIKVVILVATSGDTGKAALEGFADVPDTEIIVFYPQDGVSAIQKRQMQTQVGKNVHVFGIEGNFDDAQTGVKNIFNDLELANKLKDHGYAFSSANSINWGRLVPQIVYYFKAYASAVANGRIKAGEEINFSVPTGNFGDILAGYYAKVMGLPVKKFICASNSNNVLSDFISTGTYDKKRDFHKTVSPSMDILVSSNLERLLYSITQNSEQVAEWMKELNETGAYTVDEDTIDKIRETFFGAWVDEIETEETIGRVYNDFKYLMDPHTSVAWRACEKYRLLTSDNTYCIVLSTASPYKFNTVVLDSIGQGIGIDAEDPFMGMHKLNEVTEIKIPAKMTAMETMPVLHEDVIEVTEMEEAIKKVLNI